MYKKSRLVAKKHRLKQARRMEQRKLAHRLLKGDLRLDETERMVGEGYEGVLRTVAYLGDTLGIPIPAGITSAVSAVVSPAFSGANNPVKAKVIPNEIPTSPRRARTARKSVSNEGQLIESGSEIEPNEGSIATSVDSPDSKVQKRGRSGAKSVDSSTTSSSQTTGEEKSATKTPRASRARGTAVAPKVRSKPKPVVSGTSDDTSEPKPVRRRASRAKASE